MNPPYTHLSLDERRELFRLRSAKIPMRVIAQRLSRHPSTLYREIKRNWFQDEEPLYRGYFHVAAHAMAHRRCARLGELDGNRRQSVPGPVWIARVGPNDCRMGKAPNRP